MLVKRFVACLASVFAAYASIAYGISLDIQVTPEFLANETNKHHQFQVETATREDGIKFTVIRPMPGRPERGITVERIGDLHIRKDNLTVVTCQVQPSGQRFRAPNDQPKPTAGKAAERYEFTVSQRFIPDSEFVVREIPWQGDLHVVGGTITYHVPLRDWVGGAKAVK